MRQQVRLELWEPWQPQMGRGKKRGEALMQTMGIENREDCESAYTRQHQQSGMTQKLLKFVVGEPV